MYKELYNNTHNAQDNEIISTQYMLDKKLYSYKDLKLFQRF